MPAPLLPPRTPQHPGVLLRQRLPAGMGLAEAARRLGVSRQTLSALIHGRAAVSARMALRLAAALGDSAELWLAMQMQHDLARERANPPRGVKPIG